MENYHCQNGCTARNCTARAPGKTTAGNAYLDPSIKNISLIVESREIELQGHIIDSGIMTQILDRVMDMGGNFEFLVFDVGKEKTSPSYARLRISASNNENLQLILSELPLFYP